MPTSVSAFDYEAALRGCADRRRDALAALYHEESARLFGVARRIVGDAARAEDVVHDAFVKIWQGAASFDPQRGSARGWIYSVTRHLALNLVRDHGREIVADETTTERFDADAALADWQTRRHDGWADHDGRIGPCLEALPAERRQCVLHAYVEGLSHPEIARRLGAPLGTVKAWITRSLKALRECLS
ncbi:RNA polymerase subunit sigma [Bordetella genomosp. 1]|uniref:RNA polymerase subunit sigma n=1 Tax=Bordetella genomosp. 1 TaxID=1395607 RepID=A0A261RW43_9BORD|nr:sigma-70 family RNA polymerase sigma factor [Bordetella genomosp. 1]MDQ8031664.1 sigma-70 family RNA polymerase sigma factor [Bordetella sp.]OZI29274.1 RNA polymerase subunit sigma [Bordetella genomosp. 1]OZI64995.1 RNA polymerase subunit sigma [Bordetella genomosp. 1]